MLLAPFPGICAFGHDLRMDLASVTISCTVSGSVTREDVMPAGCVPSTVTTTVTYAGSTTKAWSRVPWHLTSAPGAGRFQLFEYVCGRDFRLDLAAYDGSDVITIHTVSNESHNGDTVCAEAGDDTDEITVEVGTGEASLGVGNSDDYIITFVLRDADTDAIIGTATVTDLTRAAILAGISATGTITLPGYTGTISFDFSISFS